MPINVLQPYHRVCILTVSVHISYIIIIITSLSKEDNIFSARTNLTYGPHKHG